MKFNITYQDINYFFNNQRMIKENILLQKATYLPKYYKNWKSFKQSFYNQRHFNFTFIDRFYNGYHIHINVEYAYRHFTHNTYNEYRQKLNATLFPTLTDPLLVIKEIEKDSMKLTFYKPFKTKDNLINVISLNLEKNRIEDKNTFEYKTLYEVNHLGKIQKLFQKPLNLVIYLKK